MTYGRRGVLVIRIGRNAVRAELWRGRAHLWAWEAPYTDISTLSAVIGQVATSAPSPCRRVRVELESPPVQIRTVRGLPPVTRDELSELVGHQVRRFFRVNGKRLATDAVWILRDGERVAKAVAVDETLLEGLATGARGAGLVIESVVVADMDVRLRPRTSAERADQTRAVRRHLKALCAVAVGVWAGVGLLFAAQLLLRHRALDQELWELKAPLAAVSVARREIQGVQAAVTAIHQAERSRRGALEEFAAVTRALPDSVVLISYAWQAGPGMRVSLAGSAQHAASVLGSLAASTLSSGQPRLEGPTVRETIAGHAWERFSIALAGERR